MITTVVRMILIPARCHVVKCRNVQNAAGASLGVKMIVPVKQPNEKRGGGAFHRRASLCLEFSLIFVVGILIAMGIKIYY